MKFKNIKVENMLNSLSNSQFKTDKTITNDSIDEVIKCIETIKKIINA